MSKGNKVFRLIEENLSKSADKKNKENQILKNNNTDINDIIKDLNLKKKKSEEDDKSMNSGESSAQELKSREKYEQKKGKTSRFVAQIPLSKKGYDKYTERLKENTMRIEIEKIYKETERLKFKYEEKNSYIHLFDNNPQFQKMLKMVQKQIIYFFIEGILLNIFSVLLYFYYTHKKVGLALSGFCLSTAEIAICIILFFSLKIGLLNDPDLSKTFRLFVIFESLLLLITFFINVLSMLVSVNYFKKVEQFGIRLLIYILFLLMVIIFIVIFKPCLNLFVESSLILLSKKTEYSILMINEINNKSDLNFNTNLSLSNNLTTEGLNNSNIVMFNIDNNKNKEMNMEEEKFKTYNYFNKFHSSITSSRNKEYGVMPKK